MDLAYPHPSSQAATAVMRGNRRRDTRPEVLLRSALHARGLRFRKDFLVHLPAGRPVRVDVAFPARRVAVFVDGCFWHGHPDFFTPGKSGPYWDAKIARTQERDRLANEALGDAGWRVIRLWDFEVETDLAACVERVVGALTEARSSSRARVHAA